MLGQLKIHDRDTVIFDIDDTMGFFTTSFDNWLAKRFGVQACDRNKFLDYDLIAPWAQHFPKTPDAGEILKEFEAEGIMADPRRFHPTSVVELARRLEDRGIACLALTARGWMEDGHGTTRSWLKALGVTMPTYVLGLKDSKAKWINENIEDTRKEYKDHSWSEKPRVWMFEDNPYHLKDIANTCLHVETPIVVDHPHNRFLSKSIYTRVDPYSTDWVHTWPN